MKPSTVALTALLAVASAPLMADAFTPANFIGRGSSASATSAAEAARYLLQTTGTGSNSNRLTHGTNLSMSSVGGGFLGQDSNADDEDDDEDEDDDDEDDAELDLAARRRSLRSADADAEGEGVYAGLKLDPYDPNPAIKPRPGRYGFRSVDEVVIPDEELVQTMSADERKENLEAMRQIKKNDLADLRLRKDHAGWVEANNDLKKRERSDPWFGLNDRMREAYQLGEDDTVTYLQGLIDKLGGPPPGVTIGPRGYALHTDIYDIGMSPARQASMIEQEIIDDRVKRHKAMAAEARKNQEAAKRKFEEKMRGGDNSDEREAKERRERMMARLMGELEEDKKKREERAKEQLGKVPDMPTDIQSSFDKALKEARDDVKKQRRRQLAGGDPEAFDDDDESYGDDDEAEEAKPKGAAAKAREKAAAEASGGRPRLPGDSDVTIGELTIPIESSSSTTTGPVTVEVSSLYNTEQSDPPMRKHCFQYTIRITNNSPTDTIQLLSRRFEIQTVGSSTKDVVQGEGVTGRQPILKPGEVFEYTSTAPLSVRPIGTTIIAARMSGEYKYITLAADQETATEEQVKAGGDASAELGMFHFVFPEEQRVKPVQIADDDDDDEDEEDEDDEDAAPPKAAEAPAAKAGRASPSSTLPGETDMESGDVYPGIDNTDASDTVTDGVRVRVTTSYKPERSDPGQNKHCFQYNIRITNESSGPIQLVSRRFEIQTVGSSTKDVVQGAGVTGRQPILKPGESFEYNSTAPLSVKPMLSKTPVVARMEGEYNFVRLGEDGTTPLSSDPLQARLGKFHFILPDLGGV